MPSPLPFSATSAGVRLSVRLVPKAKSEGILGLAPEADGAVALRVAVQAPPEHGKANAALLRLLATALRLRHGTLTLVLGATDRRKLIDIAGEPAALVKHLDEGLRPWLKRG